MHSKVVERGKKFITPAFAWSTEIEIVRGEGTFVYDRRGKKYLDFTCGTATTNIGHCPPRVVEAAQKQMEKLIHAGGNYYYESVVDLCDELITITPDPIDMFFFSNSGAEANEGAIKLARYVTKRTNIIAFRGAFHGRTLGCISLTTSNVKYRRDYGPFLPGVYIAPFPYAQQCPLNHDAQFCAGECECTTILESMFRHEVRPEEVAAVIIEPIQGEGGYVPAPKPFLAKLRELCDHHGIMLILDEVQTGFGRTAKWFACEHYDVIPDILVMAKGIASGFPLSALGANRKVMEKWSPGAHGTTFGGNPVSCAAAVATIETIKKDGLLEQATELSRHLFNRLTDIKNDYSIVSDVRGFGYMIGIEFVNGREPDPEAAKKIRKTCEKNGLLLLSCGLYGHVIRFLPPLTATKEELDAALDILSDAIKKATPMIRV
ncbi:MAG: aspartate aminotransferase family protein [Acidobacteria bacterium]|nr:aspartate aminotransferase family protein [Acidobacteriota bacterium]